MISFDAGNIDTPSKCVNRESPVKECLSGLTVGQHVRVDGAAGRVVLL
ncbi:MAG: hypothetical protein NTX50_14690 [Candidatus Sumerlaeota bacterium]|nr:hypothetical protein [Candidatus Sumerlaeota bacterium]